MADRSFEVPSWRRHGRWVSHGGFLFVLAGFGVVDVARGGGAGPSVFTLVVLALGAWIVVHEVHYRPYRVTLTDTGPWSGNVPRTPRSTAGRGATQL